MMFGRNALYTLAFFAGSKNRIYGVPCPMDDVDNPVTYRDMIQAGVDELTKLKLFVDDKPANECEKYVQYMSEYLYKGNYIKVNHFHYATDGTAEDLTSYIELIEDGNYRLNCLLKPMMVAGIMTSNPYLLKFGERSIGEWQAESTLTMNLKYGTRDCITIEGIYKFKKYHEAILIENKGQVIEYDVLNQRKRILSPSATVSLLMSLLKTPDYYTTISKMNEEVYDVATKY